MTTDGIRRKQSTTHGAKVDVAQVDAPVVDKTTSETAGGAAAKRALDALDDVKGTATGSKGRHDDNKVPVNHHPDNYALARAIRRAIRRGHERKDARPLVIATSIVMGGGD